MPEQKGTEKFLGKCLEEEEICDRIRGPKPKWTGLVRLKLCTFIHTFLVSISFSSLTCKHLAELGDSLKSLPWFPLPPDCDQWQRVRVAVRKRFQEFEGGVEQSFHSHKEQAFQVILLNGKIIIISHQKMCAFSSILFVGNNGKMGKC